MEPGQKRACLVEIKLRIARLDGEEERILRRPMESRRVEDRVIRLRKPVQREHAEDGAMNAANRIVVSNVGGMNDTQEWYGRPPMLSGYAMTCVQYSRP